jgi:tRNA pseudouridine65 synthase
MSEIESIEILARADHWLAVNKPAGLSVYESTYTGPREATLLGLLRRQLGVDRIHAIHRLDHATSGVLLLSLDARTAAELSAQFQSRAVVKTYIAVIRGEPAEQFQVDHPLSGASGRGPGKPALTEFRTLGRLRLAIPLARHPEARYALVEALPETGRYHQIRRHLKHAAHPIVGDVKYGKGEHNRLFRQHYGVHRLLLHARRLQFADPGDGSVVNVEAPFDSAFERALALFGDLVAEGQV